MSLRATTASGSCARLRVDAVPTGDAPAWVRRAWVGVTIAVPPEHGHAGRHVGSGVLVCCPSVRRAYAVPLYCATEALKLHGRHDAARWWLSQPFASDVLNGKLLFDEECITSTVDAPVRGAQVVRPDYE